MTIKTTDIAGLVVIEPRVFKDSRGHFLETFNKRNFDTEVIRSEFVQDNLSVSIKGTLRGLHFQLPPFAQSKLVSVVRGSALDVAVDLRTDSQTYGQWFSIELTAESHNQLYIPRGFAHGFLALEDDTVFSYKCDNFYSQEHEASILWNDSDLNIDWGSVEPLLSEKDEKAPSFSAFRSPFTL